MGTIITGGGSGIGAAVARQLAVMGRNLLIHGQGADTAARDRLEGVANVCRRAGAHVITRHADLAIPGHAAGLLQAAREQFGTVSEIVHAAGFADRRSIIDLPRDGLARSLAVIAMAFHEMAAAAFGDLRGAGSKARVVAVSSFVAHRYLPEGTFPASAAAKAALEALVRSLAIELAATGGTANAVAPGYTRKDVGRVGALSAETWAVAGRANPLARLAEPDEVAAAIVFLLSPGAGHITGVVLPVDGGLTLA